MIALTFPIRTSLFTLLAAVALSATSQADPNQAGGIAAASSTPTQVAEVALQQESIATPFHRRIMRDDVTIRIKNLRLDSGRKIRLIYGIPKAARKVPAVFVMDVEINSLAGSEGISPPRQSEKERRDFRHTAYLLSSPFASNMLGNGFAVAYVVADDLQTIRSARTNDWVGLFNRVRDLKPVDDNNVFLFSTREYANLSVYLASKYNFSGFILEEPNYLLFSKKPYERVVEKASKLSADEIWRETDPTREFMYETVLGRISTPILLIRNPDSNAYKLNEKTLIPKLDSVNAYYESIEVQGAGRTLITFGSNENSGVMEVTPNVSYSSLTVSKWVSEIITYMKMNSTVDPIALRDPSEYRHW